MESATLLPPLDEAPVTTARRTRRRPLVAGGLGLVVLGAVACVAWPEAAVVLETSPSGAIVAIDGRPIGQTPLRVASKPGPYRGRAEVTLDGHAAWSGPLEADPGQTRRFELTLDPLPASLALASSPPGARTSLDGRELGTTPLEAADLPPGVHTLTLDLAGYRSWQAELELEPGRRVAREMTLSPLPRPTPAANAPADLVTPPAAGLAGSVAAPPTAAPRPEAPDPAPSPGRPEPFPAIPPPRTGPGLAPLAVMVENAPDSRPQTGLGAADVVYEAMAEGGISRFMAVYFGSPEATVGPVRSARHYFVNLASELGASLIHVGASPLGYEVLRASGLRNLDETHAHPGFWRSPRRWAPHNAYTSVRGARQALDQRAGPGPGQWAGFTFKDPSFIYQGPAAPRVALDYQPWGYRVEYRYDPAAGHYGRLMEGAPHRDAESGEQIRAAGVAVLRVSAWVIDAEGRLDMDQVSHGPAAYFVDGVVVEGSWEKPSPLEPTRLLDADGNPVRFNPGPIWVQLIPYEGKVEY